MSEKLGPVETTPRSEQTYNSETLYSFTWRERPGSEDFDKGQLIVKFRSNPSTADQPPKGGPSSAYAYNVTKEVFRELEYRAKNVSRDDSSMTAGEWFNNRLVDHIGWSDRKDGDLYTNKIKL